MAPQRLSVRVIEVVEPQGRDQERRGDERQPVEHKEPLCRAAPWPVLGARHEAQIHCLTFDVAASRHNHRGIPQLFDADMRVDDIGSIATS